jgi:hypothetical protein
MVADEEGGSQRPPPPRATPSQPEPILLAEKVAAAGSSCPIPRPAPFFTMSMAADCMPRASPPAFCPSSRHA